MQILYVSDNEDRTIMELETLITNFNESDGWQFRHNEDDMRAELDTRGWYEGLHDCGRYLVLNIDKMQLATRSAHPHNETEPKPSCRHRDDGRGRCIDCDDFI